MIPNRRLYTRHDIKSFALAILGALRGMKRMPELPGLVSNRTDPARLRTPSSGRDSLRFSGIHPAGFCRASGSLEDEAMRLKGSAEEQALAGGSASRRTFLAVAGAVASATAVAQTPPPANGTLAQIGIREERCEWLAKR